MATCYRLGREPRTKELKSRGITPALVAAGVFCLHTAARPEGIVSTYEALPKDVSLHVSVHPLRGGLRQRTFRSGDFLI